MDLDEIRLKRYQELAKKALPKQEGSDDSNDEALLKKQVEMLEQNVRHVLTRDAYSRYTNLKIAHKELALQVLVMINRAVEAGKLSTLDDKDFKDLLQRISVARNRKNDYNIIKK